VADFRFENLEVWKMATEIGHRLYDLAEDLEAKGHQEHASSFRTHSCLISSILAEGSNCPTKGEFALFVSQARGASLRVANSILFLAGRELISEAEESELINMLKRESKMLDNFRQSLERAERSNEAIVQA